MNASGTFQDDRCFV